MEYYSTIKKEEVLIQATKWMNLEKVMLSERSQTHSNYMLYDSISVNRPEEANLQRQRADAWSPEARGRG